MNRHLTKIRDNPISFVTAKQLDKTFLKVNIRVLEILFRANSFVNQKYNARKRKIRENILENDQKNTRGKIQEKALKNILKTQTPHEIQATKTFHTKHSNETLSLTACPIQPLGRSIKVSVFPPLPSCYNRLFIA